MIFGRLPLDQATGAILAHAVDISPDKRLRKGHVLTTADIDMLRAADIKTVLAAKLEETDIGENDAAAAIAAPLCGDNIVVRAPFTGRTNLFSTENGIFTANKEIVNKINTLDESLTVATAGDFEKVETGQMVATVKIIPFSAKKKNVDAVVETLTVADIPALQVHPFSKRKVGVISTVLPGTKKSIVTKSEKILKDRLQRCQNDIDVRLTASHHEQDLAKGIAQLIDQGCDLILIFGASAITDRQDVVPSAISLIGGEIEHFGMPVDPGNLLLLGHKDAIDIVGLPGCTRSPKLNGFDWVLQRLLAGISVTSSDIMNMGVGGLLKEISSRPQPRSKPVKTAADQHNNSVAILILAAGQSRRMGSDNKLLAQIAGKPMLSHVAAQALKSKAARVFAVTGYDREKIKSLLENMDIDVFHNPDYADGLSSSLKIGFAALADAYEGILICLGDMPFVTTKLFDQLIDAFDREEGRAIIVPAYNGKRGNPVLIASVFKPDILAVTGDIGAKSLIAENEHVVFTVDIENNSIFRDIDTPNALMNVQTDSEPD